MADVQALRTAEAFPFQPVSAAQPRRSVWRFGLQGSEFTWAIAFLVPYAALFAAFVAYPVVYGLWLGREPALYAELFADPRYIAAALNTATVHAMAATAHTGIPASVTQVFPPSRLALLSLAALAIAAVGALAPASWAARARPAVALRSE